MAAQCARVQKKKVIIGEKQKHVKNVTSQLRWRWEESERKDATGRVPDLEWETRADEETVEEAMSPNQAAATR